MPWLLYAKHYLCLRGHERAVAFFILIYSQVTRPVLPDKALHFFVAKDMKLGLSASNDETFRRTGEQLGPHMAQHFFGPFGRTV